MAIFKNKTAQQIATLQDLETRLEHREKRERVVRFIVAGIALIVVASSIAGAVAHYRK